MKKYAIQAIVILVCLILVMIFPGCYRYYNPDKYANPTCEFEKGQRKYERKMMKKERQNRNIDPLRWNK
jgi:hypothetical protein